LACRCCRLGDVLSFARAESHNLLLLRLPSDRVPAKHEEDAGGALPIIHVPGHVRVAETDQLFVAVTGVLAAEVDGARDVAQPGIFFSDEISEIS
jgi:hypothetical protein